MQGNSQSCAQCGKAISAQQVGQPCPHCLMALGMNSANAPTQSPNHNGVDAQIPLVEQVNAAFPELDICHLVGHGGMGVVYQARQINLDRLVALKILSPRLGQDPAFAERFLREAQTMAKLSHPNIVTVFDFGKASGFYFLIMEFVDGVNLRDTISSNLISSTDALEIVPQVCEALQYAHDNGVVHRDIKPENILIDKAGSIKIADFGLAKMLDPTPNQISLTGTQQVLGTRNYMAPEQLETPEVVDHRADLYSLGVVFYELLTGELPLGRFSLPSEKRPNVSSRLDDVVMRTLEKDPGRRFQQASQIKTACESLDPSAQVEVVEAAKLRPEKPLALGPPVPVTTEDLFASLAAGYGLLRGYETHLELEVEIRDAVVDHRWASSRVEVPLDRISSIKISKKWMYSCIEVQADQFEAVKDFPGSQQGKFRLYFKKKDRELAEQLVWHVQSRIGKHPENFAPTPPVKQGSFASAVANRDTNGLLGGILLMLFLGFCVVVALGIVIGAIYWSAQKLPPVQVKTQVAPTVQAVETEVESPQAEANAQDGDE